MGHMLQKDNTAIWDFPCTRYKNYAVEITSEPSGAKIEINQGYVGETPLRYTFNGSVGLAAYTTIRALPISAGQNTQTKIFRGNEIIPARIYFDMNLRTEQPTLNLNINNQ